MSHHIDHIYYINLDHRTDRREEIENELARMGLTAERYPACYVPSFGSVGCGKSHIAVLKDAIEKGYRNVLIFEDDFMFTVSKEELESNLENLFALKEGFDVCMVSYNLNSGEPSKYDFLTKVNEAQTTAGFLVNGHYYTTLLEAFEHGTAELEKTGRHWDYAVDQIWKPLQARDNWYCFTPRFGKQRDGYSDISECICSYDC
jgi:glycosyl transferase family 25